MTQIHNHVKDLITAVEALPKSYEKNKLLSHLQDARVWAKEVDAKFSSAPHPADQCNCVAGAVAADCPVHA